MTGGLLGLVLAVLAAALAWWLWSDWRSRRPAPAPPRDRQRAILERNVPLYESLTDPERDRLHELIAGFLDHIAFEGCGGLVVDDEMRVTIAGQACLLVLHAERPVFTKLRTVLVYPTAFRSDGTSPLTGARDDSERDPRLGESWGQGNVVLAWDSVLHGAADRSDGQNLVLHEFAHQIDQENEAGDGVPLSLGRSFPYQAWSKVLERELEDLIDRTGRNQKTVLDGYGATNRAEFFAVATETFYEKPRAMRRAYPELYGLLAEFYGFDPASR